MIEFDSFNYKKYYSDKDNIFLNKNLKISKKLNVKFENMIMRELEDILRYTNSKTTVEHDTYECDLRCNIYEDIIDCFDCSSNMQIENIEICAITNIKLNKVYSDIEWIQIISESNFNNEFNNLKIIAFKNEGFDTVYEIKKHKSFRKGSIKRTH